MRRKKQNEQLATTPRLQYYFMIKLLDSLYHNIPQCTMMTILSNAVPFDYIDFLKKVYYAHSILLLFCIDVFSLEIN